MSVLEASFVRDHQNTETPSQALPLRDIFFALYSPLWPRFCEKVKKAAALLVQCALNSFIVNRILQKIAPEKHEKTT
jgi:hypothetical protein